MHLLLLMKRADQYPTCPECPQVIMDGFGYPVVVNIGCSTIQDLCCSKECAHNYKLRHLREEGL